MTIRTHVIYHKDRPGRVAYTDEARACRKLRRPHESVRHSIGEYVKGLAHTNGLESFWATLKRGRSGVYRHPSVKHLHRCVQEFSGRRDRRPRDAEERNRNERHAARRSARAGRQLRDSRLAANARRMAGARRARGRNAGKPAAPGHNPHAAGQDARHSRKRVWQTGGGRRQEQAWECADVRQRALHRSHRARHGRERQTDYAAVASRDAGRQRGDIHGSARFGNEPVGRASLAERPAVRDAGGFGRLLRIRPSAAVLHKRQERRGRRTDKGGGGKAA